MTEQGGAWKFFVALGLICLAIVGYYAFQGWQAQRAQDANTYNGFEFRQSAEGLWITQIEVGAQPYLIPFYYHPTELEDVIVDPEVQGLLLGEKPARIFISLDPDAGSRAVIAGVEISRITGHKYDLINVPTSSAFSRPPNTSMDIPIVTCADAGNGTVVIQLVQDPAANAIARDGACILLFYKTPEESVRVADRLAYMLLRIM